MIDIYLLAFVVMPIVLAALGVAYALLAERFEREPPNPRTGRVSRLP